ncbi:MAG: hypothetical protein L7H18_05515 [Candidatus Nealsonbacteria bacterium DGGOD1a]|nr:MAG: hypothetical protein L7H18_05515 [Candidatus Nealsonbacteria bacterium DGGOD1a]
MKFRTIYHQGEKMRGHTKLFVLEMEMRPYEEKIDAMLSLIHGQQNAIIIKKFIEKGK